MEWFTLDLEKPSLPLSQRVLTQESIHVAIVTIAWFSWLNAVVLWIGILKPTAHFFPFDDLFLGFIITLGLTIAVKKRCLHGGFCKLTTIFYIVIVNWLLFHGGGVVNIFYPMSFTPIIIISTLFGIKQGILYSLAQGVVLIFTLTPALKANTPGTGLAEGYGIAFSNVVGYFMVATLFGILGLAVRGLAASRKEIEEKNEELLRFHLKQERQQIARDVHGSAIQKLYVAQMKAEQAAKSMSGLNEAIANMHLSDIADFDKNPGKDIEILLANVTGLVKEAISQLRALVLERDANHGGEGFTTLIEAAIKEIDSMTGQTTRLEISPSVYLADRVGNISPEIITGTLEIMKEAIINAAKHAEASQLKVNASIEDQGLRIVVQDNGKGFTVKNLFAFTVRRNFGLYDMRRRCQELGGKFRITSEPGQGTCVDVLLPLSRPQPAQPSPFYTETLGKNV